MWKQKNSTNLLTLFFIILTSQLLNTDGALSDKRLCADEKCTKPISIGMGAIEYRPGERGMVPFKRNEEILIMSKSAGSNKELWGVKVGGREGYAPRRLIRETKLLESEKNVKFEVDVQPPEPAKSLSVSEKLLDKENTAAETTTTTEPLNLTSMESIKNPLVNDTNEVFKTGSPPAITTVQSEVVDGTKIATVNSDMNGNMDGNSNPEMEQITQTNGYDVKHQQDENFQQQQQEPEDNNNVVKESVEKANDNATQVETKLEATTENLEDQRKSAVEEPINANVKEIQDNAKISNLFHQAKIVDLLTPKTTAKHSNVNVNDADETATTNQNSVPAADAENSLEISSATMDNKDNSKIAEDQEDFKAKQANNTESAETKSSVSAMETIPKSPEFNWTEKENKTVPLTENYNSTTNSAEDNKQEQKPSAEEIDDISQSEEIADANIETPGKAVDDGKVMPEDNSADKVVKSDFGSNPDEKAEAPNDSSSQAEGQLETVTKNQLKENSSENIEQSGYGPNTESGTKATDKMPSGKAMHEENLSEPSVGPDPGPYTAKTDEVYNDNPLQPVQTSDSSSNATGEVPSEEEVVKDKYQHEMPSGNEKIPTSTEDNGKSDLSDTLNSNSKHDEHYHSTTETPPLSSPTISTAEPYHDNSAKVPINTEYGIANNSEDKLQTPQVIGDTMRQENINDGVPSNAPSSSPFHYNYQEPEVAKVPSTQTPEVVEDKKNLLEKHVTESSNNMATEPVETNSHTVPLEDEPKPLQSSTPLEQKENTGLFATIMGTVNNMLSTSKKTKQNELDDGSELDRILFSEKYHDHEVEKLNEESNFQYCKNIGPNGDCPETEENHATSKSPFHQMSEIADLTLDTFLKSLATKILEKSELLGFLVIVAAAALFFAFGYYCFCNSSREGALLLKLNQLESSLLASHKENAILKHNLMSTRHKLTSIEDNSFGSNDMVVSLKNELEEELMEKARLREQITVLQKELEIAADAGIELNKIVSELLSNQTGDESIISSVEELQKQLNEQQNTIFEINASLAEKSRENSELQLLIAEQNARYETELANVQRDNDELEQEKGNLITRLDEMKNEFDKDISAALEGKNMEIKRLQSEIIDLTNRLENEHTKWQTSVAKIEALEECLKNVRKDPNVNITEVIDVANVKAQLIEIQKKYSSLKEKLETESDSRKLAENQLQVVSAEVEKLKQDFNQSEKDKLEAQTRLEVLSNYFKDKENQLQKELSVKEAMWLKQQGETTTTVDRLTAMQEEIQSLKSLNDSLRAEIEAQVAAHKAQTGTLENRAHETWLAARQSDRRYEEARAEATALRRRLTALAGGNVNEVNKNSSGPVVLTDELTQAPSPIHMESPGSPMLGRLPPPPFLPPPFMGHPPPFIGMPPPPPFVPPGEMRPAPLGRIMSPPPQRSGRFSPQHLDYEDYLDYESNNTWHRHTYSPPPRTYRSLSPTDSRYNYGAERDLISTYDTETDFSPPPSPRESRRRGDNSSDRIDNNAKISYGNAKKFNTSNKGPLSSGSEKSFNTRSHNDMKTIKGNAGGGGGKTFV